MELSRTRHLLPRVEWLDSVDSTNAALRGLCDQEGDAVPHGTLIATANQTSGRGRLGRGWVTPPSTALAASVLVRGDWPGTTQKLAQDHDPLPISWLPLLAGSAVATTLQPLFRSGGVEGMRVGTDDTAFKRVGTDGAAPKRVGVKWPNDVHVRDEADAESGSPGQKLCGILCEVVPTGGPEAGGKLGHRGNSGRGETPGHGGTSGHGGTPRYGGTSGHGGTPGHGGNLEQGSGAVIVGIGINLLIPEWQLPTERATSVLAAGGDVGGAEDLDDAAGQDLADRVLAGVAGELLRLCEQARSDPHSVRTRVLRHSLTLGTEVRVHLPGGEMVDGRARALAADGSLVVDLPTGGQLEVSAADVEHLR